MKWSPGRNPGENPSSNASIAPSGSVSALNYLLISAGGFRARGNQLWQLVFSVDGVRGGYTPENLR